MCIETGCGTSQLDDEFWMDDGARRLAGEAKPSRASGEYPTLLRLVGHPAGFIVHPKSIVQLIHIRTIQNNNNNIDRHLKR